MNPSPPPGIDILIVEDSPTQAMQLRQLLLRHFPKVEVARDGTEALAKLAADPATLVISDVNMPGIDGYELCRRMKSDARLASIPVILVTHLDDPSDVMKGLECGASSFLSKPYEESYLLARIQFILANPRLARAQPVPSLASIEVVLGGEKYVITSRREQILDFVLSTYELALRKNREAQIASEKLEERTRELERSNGDLEQFASIASHDLHEPLRMVASYIGLLERRASAKLDQKEKSYIGFATDGAKRMQQMISDLLTWSRVGTRGHAFEKAEIATIFHSALANLEIIRAEKGATITHDALPTAQIDASQFTRLFQNLIGNALKFVPPERAPLVHVGCEQRGREWIFSVRDNGIGIEPQNFDRVFALFQRLHSRSQYPGTGIGLAVCKKIVERHGGRLWIESEVGKGTTFFFTIASEET